MKATVWKNTFTDKESQETRNFQSVVFKKVYREDDEWKESENFSVNDLLRLQVVLNRTVDELLPPKVTEN